MDTDHHGSLRKILAEYWENAFHVRDAGSDIDIYVEVEDTESTIDLWKHIPHRIGKKDVIIFKVPMGVIDEEFKSKTKN